MGRQSSYLTSFGRTHCLRLPPPTDDAWNWQLRASCLGHPLEPSSAEEAAKRICRQCPWERARELVGHGHARRSLPSAGQASAVQ